MNFSLWVLGLGAVGAILFLGRRRWQKKVATAQYDKAKRKSDAEEAELDRRACLDLGKSLMSTVPGSRSETGSAKSEGSKNPD